MDFGVCDMKGGIAAFLKAITSIDYSKLKSGLKLYLTFDEEIGFNGIKSLLKTNEDIPKNVIVVEPTNLKPVVALKGDLDIKVTFFGKSVHSSIPNNGISAILMVNSFINELLVFSNELEKDTNEIFTVPYTTINVGKINGGDSINKVPNLCVIEFDVRIIRKEHAQMIKQKLKEILTQYNCKIEIINEVMPLINDNTEFIEQIEELTQMKAIAENYVTEANFIEGVNAVVLGAGPITAHQTNEYVEIDKLNDLVKMYIKIIEQFCYIKED